MTVRIAFVKPKAVDYIGVQLLTGGRALENLTIPASTTATAQESEAVVVINEESSTVMVATGSSPDASKTSSDAASSAGVPVAAGATVIFALNTGDKVNVKAAV